MAFTDSAGRYLLLKRSPEKYPEVLDPWDIIGGRIEVGTPLFANLQREVKEETDLELREPPRLVAAQDILKSAEKHVVRLTYTGPVPSGEIRLDEDHGEYRWFTKEELLALDTLDEFFRSLLEQELI